MPPCPIFCILPPHLLKEILQRGTAAQKNWAWLTLTRSEQMRGRRQALSLSPPLAVVPSKTKWRTVYDVRHGDSLPGRLVREEGDPKGKDPAVNEAYDGAGVTYDLFFNIYGRRSIDDRGSPLNSTVHFSRHYDNAFWNGHQMIYGDGDGDLFRRFTIAVDIIGHELTHGVTQYEARLAYEGEPGALNESFSDVFGSLVKQYQKNQPAKKADWLIGKGLFTSRVKGVALRSMKTPGSAYDDPVLGKDPQPGHMKDFVRSEDDNGGVHINSGIPNRAFYETAMRLGGMAWSKAGQIWYVALRDQLKTQTSFQAAAQVMSEVAKNLFGKGSLEQKAVQAGWQEVGIEN